MNLINEINEVDHSIFLILKKPASLQPVSIPEP